MGRDGDFGFVYGLQFLGNVSDLSETLAQQGS